ncbi:glycosyl hydrolase family 47 protein [Nitzschia inconspicua]|uniref:mannosyl-oligosaccharide 1,2-alpha-mannosidase n=1 Tax=Nitzschia inconspicua TaxID=303405 RepID=A0A9K3KQ20_9STRA|nr:glycosyl hydrolase family 47 protein [Nitzschia inconspicua]
MTRPASKTPISYRQHFVRRSGVILVIIVVLAIFLWESGKPWYHSDNFKDKRCRHMDPIEPPDLSKLSPLRRERFERVRDSIAHAWKGYADAVSLNSTKGGGVIPADNLTPISKSRNGAATMNWLYYGATLHDAIDTLYLANLTVEYNEAVDILTRYDIQTTSIQATKTFEYSLRILGGLLGAYSLSGEPRLFASAQNAADSLLQGPFQASPSITPRPFNVLAPSSSSWDWKTIIQRFYKFLYIVGRNHFTSEHKYNSLAGFGSFGLEFSFLSTISGEQRYRKTADVIFQHVKKYEHNGIVPERWNVLTGTPESMHGSLGSGSDSFYEYLIKVPIFDGCYYDEGMEMYSDECTLVGKDHLELYQKMLRDSLRSDHVKRQSISGPGGTEFVFPTEFGTRYDHLLCFLPGLLALAAHTQGGNNKDDDMALARDLLDGCHQLYTVAASGLSADTGRFQSKTFVPIDSSYYLRPEFVESLFVLYRFTKDETLQDAGWEVFESLESHCKIPGGGYAGLKDVNNPSAGYVDDMPSYFIAETLKYLLLLFGPDDYISLDDFVFTTEGHPLRKIKRKNKIYRSHFVSFCLDHQLRCLGRCYFLEPWYLLLSEDPSI